MQRDVCAVVVQTQLCGPSDRRAALAALVCSTGGDAEPGLTDAGCQAAALCGAVLLDNLAGAVMAGSLAYLYRLHAMQALTDLPQAEATAGLNWHARLIVRDAVYAAAVHVDRASAPTPEGWEDNQSEIVIDSLQQNGWCERVGGWALRSMKQRVEGEQERQARSLGTCSRPKVAGTEAGEGSRAGRAERLKGRLMILDCLVRPGDLRNTVQPINVDIDRGGMTWPTPAAVHALVKFDTHLLSHMTTHELHRRGEGYYDFLLSNMRTDAVAFEGLSRAISDCAAGHSPSRLDQS